MGSLKCVDARDICDNTWLNETNNAHEGKRMNKMNAFQQAKAKELTSLGWVEKVVEHHHTGRDRVPTYMHMFETESGRRCYLAPTYLQHA